jgi:hypothetical protein
MTETKILALVAASLVGWNVLAVSLAGCTAGPRDAGPAPAPDPTQPVHDWTQALDAGGSFGLEEWRGGTRYDGKPAGECFVIVIPTGHTDCLPPVLLADLALQALIERQQAAQKGGH